MGRGLYEELPGEPGFGKPIATTTKTTGTPGFNDAINGWR